MRKPMLPICACLATIALAAPHGPASTLEDIRYPSRIDNLEDLRARVAVPVEGSRLPVLVVMHGLRERASSIHDDALTRMATAYGGGVFVIAVEMRGRGESGGSPDAGGREIQDIVDAVHFARERYGTRIDGDQVHIAGYSGGGGNAMICAARYPDLFNSVASFFGISDYGTDSTHGWYAAANPAQQEFLRRWIGGTPAELPDAYRSRSPVLAITNYTGGVLRLFHDRLDRGVPPAQSTRVAETMAAAGLRNCSLSITGPGDNPRWLHAAPNGNAGVIQAERYFLPEIAAKRLKPWTVPVQGTLKVAGYLETRRFSVWLGNGTAATASLTYDTAKRVFILSAHPPAVDWTLSLKGCKPGTNAALTVNGRRYSRRADRNGTAVIRGRL